MTFDEGLLAIILCPLTPTKLRYDLDSQKLVSEAAGLAYPIRDGLAVLLIDEARKISA